MADHKVTVKSDMVTKSFGTFSGTVVDCTCGYHDEWAVNDGSAEQNAYYHQQMHIAESVEDDDG